MRLVAVVVLAACLAACDTLSSHSDYDHSVDFSGYRTFAWISEKPMIAASPDVSPLAQGRIQRAITSTLAAKGIRYVEDPAAADFVIAFTVGSRQEIRASPGWGAPYYDAANVDAYTQGRLAIDVFDAKKKQPVWTGVATKSVTGADQANVEALINKAVAKILESFPPP